MRISLMDLIVKRRELIKQRNEIEKDLQSIKYVVETLGSERLKLEYKEYLKKERMKNLKQFKTIRKGKLNK